MGLISSTWSLQQQPQSQSWLLQHQVVCKYNWLARAIFNHQQQATNMVLLLMKIVSCWWPFLFGCYNQWRFQISSHHLPSTLSEIFLKIRPRLSQKNWKIQKSLSENFQKRLGENLSPDCHWSPTMAMSSLGTWHSHGLPCSAGKFSMLGWKNFANSRLSENSKICKLVHCKQARFPCWSQHFPK